MKSFLKKLFGASEPEASGQAIGLAPRPPIDARTPECPYCKGELKKIPGAKTKCPHCGQFMYVRTSPNEERYVHVNRGDDDWFDYWWFAGLRQDQPSEA
jgi:predicted RNA-binding Zn-ribbon protein involved in translation (DUF1610 family)